MGEIHETEGVVGSDDALEARLRSVVDAIMGFHPREPHHHPNLCGGEASIPFERILASLARGREAIDLAIGEGLSHLEDRDQLMDLGYSRMIDYAREELGLPASTARERVRLAQELKSRPLLRKAVLSGRLSPRHARELLPVARGAVEGRWVTLAATLSVRELHRAVKRARAAPEGPAAGPASGAAEGGEPWTLLSIPLRPECRPAVEKALRLAEETLWRGAPVWMQLEALIQEYLGGKAIEVGEDDLGEPAGSSAGAIPPGELERALEIESNGWDWLEALEPVAAPELSQMEPETLHARLQDLVEKREGWDEAFGMVARVFVQKRLAAKLGFANLGHYLEERLGMSRRAFEQRVWLERRMEGLPQLRHALAQGEVSYEKARLVAGVADFDTVNQWIRRAAGMTCVELERAIAGAEHAQACARGEIGVRTPLEVARLFQAVLRGTAEAIHQPLEPGECLWGLALHFIETWEPLLPRRTTPSRRSRQQNGGRCSTPGCSRPSAQDHHLVFKSHGGSDDPTNRTPLCAPHHLRGIHGGRLRLSGTAPDRLVWTLRSGRTLGTAPPRSPFRRAVGPR